MSLGDFTSSVLSCVGDASYSKKTFFVAHLQRVTHAAPSAVFLQKARSTLATMSKQHCRSNRQLCCLLLRQCCRFGQQCRSNVRLCRSNIRLYRKDEISTQNSFDIVAVFGNKVERCFDIVAGVDRA